MKQAHTKQNDRKFKSLITISYHIELMIKIIKTGNVIICLFRISKSLETDKTRPIAYRGTHESEIIEIVTHVKRASALKCGSKSNSVTRDIQLYVCLSTEVGSQ
jgi:hypothetical protein